MELTDKEIKSIEFLDIELLDDDDMAFLDMDMVEFEKWIEEA